MTGLQLKAAPWLVAGLLTIQLGCAGSIFLTDVWMAPDSDSAPVNRILVVGLTPRDQVRSMFEYQLVHDFTSQGVEALASVNGIPRDVKLDRQSFAKYFGDTKIDAVLITGLVRADTVIQYQQGDVYAAPAGYYRTWHGYYTSVYSVHQDPGYWTQTTEFVLESNLYDVASEALIWRCVSKAVDPDNVTAVIEDLSKILVDRLAKDGLVVLQNKEQ